MKNEVVNNMETLKCIAEKLCDTDGETITFTNMFETSGEVNDSEDWKNTIHYYRIKMECTVVKNEEEYEMYVKYGIIDYYDWEIGENEYKNTESVATKYKLLTEMKEIL